MTGASKILTVSYGTFSCTLEGFDDPFNTMKAIAEYFRDLAADDRYFGAEPPTPDAAMLHRIAEREIQRRVEAKIQDNGVILRAGETEEAPAPAPRPALSPAAVTADSVAAKLQRIREKHANIEKPAAGPVAEAPVAPVIPAPADQAYIEDEHAEAAAPTVAETVHVIEEIGHADQIDALLAVVEAEAPATPPEADAAVPAVLQAADEVEDIDLSDQFADLPEAEDYETEDVVAAVATAHMVGIETETAAAEEAEAEDEDLSVLESISAELTADTQPEAQFVSEDDLPEDYEDADFDSAMLEALAAEPEVEAVADEDLSDDDEVLSSLGTLIEDADDAPVIEATVVEPEAPALAEMLPEPDEAILGAIAAEAAPVPAPAAETPAQRARARVIRIRRAEPAAAAPAPAPVAEPEGEATVSALSAEEEAALQAELAALEAELAAPAQPAEPLRRVAPVVEIEEPRKQTVPAESDEALGRLMAKAASEMDDEATVRRQSAIAHLKAAVAATEADRKAGVDPAGSRGPRIDDYREDLDRVVRPRRPVSDGASTPRPSTGEGTGRPTPLVLVSEQRIDRPKPSADAPSARPVMPVRPRRIVVGGASGAANAAIANVAESGAMTAEEADLDDDDLIDDDEADNVFADAMSFEDFADQLGAINLPELLEAAAVYCAEVLRRPEFSRPLVMRQIAGLPGNVGSTREDCLRGFGTLLRNGRIAKVKRGLFALTDRSPYLAEARKMVG